MGDTEQEAYYCNTNLQLGLGLGEHYYAAEPRKNDQSFKKNLALTFVDVEEHNNSDSKESHDQNNGYRKKLKLTEGQTKTLESYFKSTSTPSPAQKKELAGQLNLKQRQVEVWFQNRRARTKVKQTEEDHEMLKRSCENLKNENRKLKKELQELRSQIKVEPHQHEMLHFPSTANPASKYERD